MSATSLKPCLLLADATQSQLSLLAVAQGWLVQHTDSNLYDASVAVVILGEPSFVEEARVRFPGALLVGHTSACRDMVDLSIDGWEKDTRALSQVLEHAKVHWQQHRELTATTKALSNRQRQMQQLSEIGVALSSQLSLNDLLSTLLREACGIAECDAASLYLVERDADADYLRFKLTRNDSIDFAFKESRVPLSSESLAGYVAKSGEDINLVDVYDLPANVPYSFNRSFDEKMNYRTRSMLVLPLRDHNDLVVGVLQFMNRKCAATGDTIAFDAEIVEILRAVTSQAALSILKSRLVRDINELFESFVQASVKAIEQRDPSTSGHSARVAETTVDLFRALPNSNLPRFKNLSISQNDLREVRYAALLHDFGKVGVREAVLVKSHKLSDERLEIISYRVQLQKERLRRSALQREMHLLHDKAQDFEVARARIHRELQSQLSQLDDYFGMIVAANNPTVRVDGDFAHLKSIESYQFIEDDGSPTGLISKQDLAALSVRRGSLTQEERVEIEAHVQHTRDFLAVLPWPEELSQVPLIAGSHHEKLNGTGYPVGLEGDQIPLASRVMTVCDIYDALTAMDRPYKSAISQQAAFDILYEEAKAHLLDIDLVNIFVASRKQLPAREVG